MANKNVKLRIFEISKKITTEAKKDILSSLKKEINKRPKVIDRAIYVDDDKKEFDTLSSFKWLDNNSSIFGVIMRIEKENNFSEISQDLYKKKTFSIDEILSPNGGVDRCKDYYYFLLTNNYLVSNIRTTYPVSRITKYLNSMMEEEYNFIDVLKDNIIDDNNNIINISDIKKIEINEELGIDLEGTETKLINIPIFKEVLDSIFEGDKLNELKERNLINAKILLTIAKKPKKMTKEEYKRLLSGVITPLKEDSNISIITKDNERIKKNIDLKHTISVSIKVEKNKKLNEDQLQEEMSKFVKDTILNKKI